MKAIPFKCAAAAGLMLVGLANQSMAVNVAEAVGMLTDLEVVAVQANAELANVSLGGDVDAIAEYNQRAAAIDESVVAGREAVASVEAAAAAGDEDSAAAAQDDLAQAFKQANDALAGVLPVTAAEPAQTIAEGDPGRGENPPNIYDVPWKSEGIRAYYESEQGIWDDASSFGPRKPWDRDATRT